MDKKSPDAFRTISEVAEWLGVPTHVLRFWESRFTQVKPVKRAGGRRYYRPSDMALLGGIRKLLHEDGMTIRGVQKLLREHGAKHVAEMSPPIESDGSHDQDAPTASNVVPFDSRAEEVPPVASTAPHVDALQPSTEPDVAADPADLPPQTPETTTEVSAEITSEITDETPAEVPEAPMAFPDHDDAVPPETPDVVTFGEEPGQLIEPAATTPPIDPLEPIPHDGPTLAETLETRQPTPSADDLAPPPAEYPLDAENAGLDVAEIDAGMAEHREELPESLPEDGATPTDQIGDLFSFADTLSTTEDTMAAGDIPDHDVDVTAEGASAEEQADLTPEASPEAPLEMTEDLAPDTGTEVAPDPQVDLPPEAPAADTPPAPVAPPTPSLAADAPAEPDETAADDTHLAEMDAAAGDNTADSAAEAATAAPLMGDISHIPTDPDDESVAPPLPALPPVLRDAKSAGTNVHLPVLQALADRLEALAGQMDRTHGI